MLDMSIYYDDQEKWLDSQRPLDGYREVKQGYRVSFEMWCMRPALVRTWNFFRYLHCCGQSVAVSCTYEVAVSDLPFAFLGLS